MIISQMKGDIKLGAVVSLISYTAFWISLMNFVLVSLIAYNTTIKVFILEFLPWFNFFWYLVCIACVVVVVMIIEYKIIIPSRHRFSSSQEYAHDSPIQKDFEMMKRDFDIVKEELKIIKEQNVRLLQKYSE